MAEGFDDLLLGPRFVWENTASASGMFSTADELWAVLARLGRMPTFRWVQVSSAVHQERAAQVSGDPSRGVLVHTLDQRSRLVPAGADRGPVVDVGSWLSPFWAVPAELLGVHTAAAVLTHWLNTGLLPEGFEFRDV